MWKQYLPCSNRVYCYRHRGNNKKRVGLQAHHKHRIDCSMPNLTHERRHGFHEGKTVCGVDEVGRGPLAGPVMAAAVILPAKLPSAVKREIRDSKKMTPQARSDLFDPLTQLCRYAVAEASVEEIARYNIL